MKERPIPFNSEMVAAILDGRKTQTRRVVKPSKCKESGVDMAPCEIAGAVNRDRDYRYCPYGQPSDRLYVREPYYQQGYWEEYTAQRQRTRTGRQRWRFVPTGEPQFEPPAEFRKGRHHKDPHTVAWHKRLGRFMPKAYNRLSLDVTDIRIERVQQISDDDAIAEGIDWSEGDFLRPQHVFQILWNSIHGGDAWDRNDWVWVVEFKRIEA